MKQATGKFLTIAAAVLISAGVAGYTSYKVTTTKKSSSTEYSELFQQNPSSLALAGYTSAQMQPVDLTQAAEVSVHAVVHIRSKQLSKTRTIQTQPDFFDFFFGDGSGQQRQIQTQPSVGYGSGVIISKDGYIVTNNHVVENADEITVKLNDETEFLGKLIGTDPDTDLALIKIDGDDFPTLPVGNSDELKVGEWVLAVGNPFNLNSTVTAGIVSAKARSIGTTASNGQAASVQSFIQTDAAINSGNSGGALVNSKGELVGINAMLYSPTGAYSGYGFAIPTSIMTKVVADLKQYGTVQRALLGIRGTTLGTDLSMDEEASEQLKEKMDQLGAKEGVLVAEVVDGGSAVGVLQADDVITGINSRKIRKFSELQEALSQFRPGDKISVTIIRDKKEKTVSLTLKNSQGNTKVVKNSGMDELGATFRPVSSQLKQQLQISYGLEVTGVASGKFQQAGIRKGFIILKANNESIRSEEDLENVLRSASQSPEQVIFISGIFTSGRRGNYLVELSDTRKE